MATVTDEQRAEIVRRANAGAPERVLAREYGISRTQVWDIKQAAKKTAR
jgi:DNA invertase Pin-like site-specific DNA recombinase